jgi:hypothetical protein
VLLPRARVTARPQAAFFFPPTTAEDDEERDRRQPLVVSQSLTQPDFTFPPAGNYAFVSIDSDRTWRSFAGHAACVLYIKLAPCIRRLCFAILFPLPNTTHHHRSWRCASYCPSSSSIQRASEQVKTRERRPICSAADGVWHERERCTAKPWTSTPHGDVDDDGKEKRTGKLIVTQTMVFCAMN